MSTDSDVEETPAIVPLKSFGPINLYWADKLDTLEQIEASGVNIYYVIGNEKIVSVVNGTSKTFHHVNIFRVENSLLGRSIVSAEMKELDLFSQIEPGATYNLPKMPYKFVALANAFFQKAHDVHHTEAVLVLTYDPSYFDSDDPTAGWGFLVPDQENTASNCKYDPSSVKEFMPENVRIVGTWHSHPLMSAFFSGTDHHDQDDWDGIHITTGWLTGKPYEYHIALVMGGQNWTYKPEQVFDVPPLPEVDLSGIDEMVGKVKKKVHPTTTVGSTVSGGTHSSYANKPQLQNGSGAVVRAIRLPANAPDPRLVTIVACVDPESVNHKCPFCLVPLSDKVWNSRRCIACQNFLMLPDDTLNSLVEYRKENGKHYVMAIDPTTAPNPIVVWLPGVSATDPDVFSDDMRELTVTTIDETLAELVSPPKT